MARISNVNPKNVRPNLSLSMFFFHKGVKMLAFLFENVINFINLSMNER